MNRRFASIAVCLLYTGLFATSCGKLADQSSSPDANSSPSAGESFLTRSDSRATFGDELASGLMTGPPISRNWSRTTLYKANTLRLKRNDDSSTSSVAGIVLFKHISAGMAVAFPLSLALIVLTRNHLPAKPCLPLRGSTLFVELYAHTCRRR